MRPQNTGKKYRVGVKAATGRTTSPKMSQLCFYYILSVIMNSEIAIFSKSESPSGKFFRHAILPILLTTVAFLIQIFNNNFISKYGLTDKGRISEFSSVSVSSMFLFSLQRFLRVWQKIALKFTLTDMFPLV